MFNFSLGRGEEGHRIMSLSVYNYCNRVRSWWFDCYGINWFDGVIIFKVLVAERRSVVCIAAPALTCDKVLILMDRAYSSSQSQLLTNAWSVETVGPLPTLLAPRT